jgi:hypothetical protein
MRFKNVAGIVNGPELKQAASKKRRSNAARYDKYRQNSALSN